MKRVDAIAVAALALLVASADASCSATATAAWKAKCSSRTTGNKDFLPLTDMSANTINVDESNLVDTYNQARLTALKLSGAVGSAAMDGMRKKSRAWYETSLRKIMTFLCVETATGAELQRCVNATSEDAERDVNGECVVLTDAGNCHSQGLCERESNCKWDDALPTSTSARRELFTDANVTTAKKWMSKEYPTTFAPFIAPGIVFSVLTALTAVAFILLRCVFNQCGGRNPDEKGYTRCDILIPTVVFLVCSAAVFICSFITIAQNTNISDGVTGVINSLNVTLENIDIFASNIKAPLAEAEQQLASAKITVNAQVKDLGWVADDGAKLAQMLADFGAYYQTRGPFPFSTCNRTNAWCVVCPDAVCGSSVKTFVANTTDAYTASGALVATQIATMKKAFVADSDAITLSLKTATKDISELVNLTRSSKSVVDVIATTVDDYSFSRSALVLSVFLFGVFSSLVGAFAIFKGVCKKKTAWVHMLHVSWFIGVLVCILGFVLSASLLAVGALWYDSCNYMNILHSDISPYFPSGVSTIVNACFADTGVLSPLQVEDALSFQCELSDQYTGVSSADFSATQALIKAYGTRVSNFGLRDFGYDAAVWKDIRDKANAAIENAGVASSTSFTKDNIIKPWAVYNESSAGSACSSSHNVTTDQQPICYMDAKCASSSVNSAKDSCKETFANAYYYQLAYSKIAVMLNEMRQDVLGDSGASFSGAWKYDTSLYDYAQDYFNRVLTVRTDSLDYLMKGEVGRVLETVERARCTESCGWINISFNAVHEALCTDILGTTLAISLCVFFLCVFMVPLIVTGITLHKRLRGSKKGTYDELEKRLQQLESKQREEARAKRAATAPINGDKKSGIDLFKFKKNLDSA